MRHNANVGVQLSLPFAFLLLALIAVGCPSGLTHRDARPDREVGTMSPDLPLAEKMCQAAACTKDADCTSPLKCDTGKGTCTIQCTADSDCLAFYKGGCNAATGFCAQCKADADCLAGPQKCNTATGFCYGCAANADCTIAGVKILTGLCDATSNQCVKCSTDADCGYTGSVTKVCGTKSLCVACKVDADCTTGPKKCLTATNTCAACAKDADCTKGTANTGICASNYCYGCVVQQDCDTAFTTFKMTCK